MKVEESESIILTFTFLPPIEELLKLKVTGSARMGNTQTTKSWKQLIFIFNRTLNHSLSVYGLLSHVLNTPEHAGVCAAFYYF